MRGWPLVAVATLSYKTPDNNRPGARPGVEEVRCRFDCCVWPASFWE
ncbi:MAG: hypothetical protein C207_05703 [Bradyrhizobium sp. DFCI-1]|jgi:hypothetical protein|nr:MAG: hypothetical protein C207_05703 [Bradyrhizobium sp. DFCI-1]